MNDFQGQWNDGNTSITVTSTANNVSVKYSNGRGPFTGYEIDLYSPVISVNFTDDKPFTGVLVNGNTIAWSNGTSWRKA